MNIVGIDRNCTHLAGEYFVAAELYRRGYNVAITLGNAKAIDLFAEKDSRTINIQVKAISTRKSNGWPIMRDKILDDVMYVFVCVNEPPKPPDYYLCTPREARNKVQQYETRGVIYWRTLGDPAYQERWDKIAGASLKLEKHRGKKQR